MFLKPGVGLLLKENDAAYEHIVFWSNHRVGCIEPFIPYSLDPGDEFEWTYIFEISETE